MVNFRPNLFKKIKECMFILFNRLINGSYSDSAFLNLFRHEHKLNPTYSILQLNYKRTIILIKDGHGAPHIIGLYRYVSTPPC